MVNKRIINLNLVWVTLLLCSSPVLLSGQEGLSGKLIYHLESHGLDFSAMGEKLNENKTQGLDSLLNKSEQCKFEVSFAFGMSYSRYTEGNAIDQKFIEDNFINMNMSKIAALSAGEVYYDWSRDSIYHLKSLEGKEYTIHMSAADLGWELTDEMRKIGKYNCRKAVRYIIRNNVLLHDTLVIEAWYTPELPMPIGPSEYVGLPGLVVEVKKANAHTYRLYSAVFSPVSEIKITKKGRNVTLGEFKEIERLEYEDFYLEVKTTMDQYKTIKN